MPGHGAGLEREAKTGGEALGRGLRRAHIGAHRHMHADKAGRAREHRADQEADGAVMESRKAMSTKMTTPTMAMVVYWRVR